MILGYNTMRKSVNNEIIKDERNMNRLKHIYRRPLETDTLYVAKGIEGALSNSLSKGGLSI